MFIFMAALVLYVIPILTIIVAIFILQVVLQQPHHIVAHAGPHRVTSSNIYQIKAQSLGSSKLLDTTFSVKGERLYTAL